MRVCCCLGHHSPCSLPCLCLLFSATMPPAVERLARKYMRKPIVINIGRAGQVTDNVTQRVFVVKENEKAARLEQVIKLGSMVKLSMKFKNGYVLPLLRCFFQELDLVTEKRAIVFVNTKRQCDNVFNHMESIGHRCDDSLAANLFFIVVPPIA